MSIPAASHDGKSHRLLLSQIAIRLRKQYAELLKTPPSSRMMTATDPGPTAVSRQARPRANRRRPGEPRRHPPVFRFPDPPLRNRDAPRRHRRTNFARLFTLMLLLHVIVIGGIVIQNLVESSIIWKAIGGAVVIWIFFRILAALSRRITPPRKTTTRVIGRNCDRDIWL